MNKPAFTFSNDTTTGFYFKKSGQVRFVVNGLERNIHGYFAHAMRRIFWKALGWLR